jgi:AraC-like DNA-binding protein
VECYWRATSDGSPGFRSREPLVPDLRIELIFNAGPAWDWYPAGGETSRPSAALTCIGMRGSALAIRQPGRLDHFAIRFRPAGLTAFAEVPVGELTQRCWDMRELWHARTASELAERLASAVDDESRVERVDAFLLALLLRSRRDAQLARQAAHMLAMSHGQLPIGRLASQLGVDYKRLERAFVRDVGLSPKHFARVARLQRAMELSVAQPRLSLARIAVASGFADQAHFSRDFGCLMGVSPRTFFGARFAVFETMAMSGSVGIRAEEPALSKTFKMPRGPRTKFRP